METQNVMTELKFSSQAAESEPGTCRQQDHCVKGGPEKLPQRRGPGQRAEKEKRHEKYRGQKMDNQCCRCLR